LNSSLLISLGYALNLILTPINSISFIEYLGKIVTNSFSAKKLISEGIKLPCKCNGNAMGSLVPNIWLMSGSVFHIKFKIRRDTTYETRSIDTLD